MDSDIDPTLEEPVQCPRCKRWIELQDAYHAPDYRRCVGRRSCDNLICVACFKDAEGYP